MMTLLEASVEGLLVSGRCADMDRNAEPAIHGRA
jgi:hypothetical protein